MNKLTDKVGIAVIGCGYWGVNYVRVFHELPGAQVVAICDGRSERLQEMGKRFPHARQTTDVAELLQWPGIDAVVICTGATTHFAVAQRCLQAGKHVLVEKPMATTVADARQLVACAKAQRVTLMVGHTFLYNAGIRKVKEYMQRADMGQIYYLYARRTNLGPIRQDVNALWDLAPHDVSIFNYLLDQRPRWVSAVGAHVLQNCREDVGFISLGYANETIGNIHVSWAEPNKVRELVVVGSSKRIVFDDLNAVERVKIYEKGVTPTAREASTYGEYQFQIRDGDIFSPSVAVSEPLKEQCNHFLECVTQGLRPLTDGQAGVAVVQVLQAIEQSVAQHGAPVTIEPLTIEPEVSSAGNGFHMQGNRSLLFVNNASLVSA